METALISQAQRSQYEKKHDLQLLIIMYIIPLSLTRLSQMLANKDFVFGTWDFQ